MLKALLRETTESLRNNITLLTVFVKWLYQLKCKDF